MYKLNLKTTLLSLSTAFVLGVTGCSDGGGATEVLNPIVNPVINPAIAAPLAVASLSGTTGEVVTAVNTVPDASGVPAQADAVGSSAPVEGTATLVVDYNANDIFGGEDGEDLIYTSPIIAGAFSFGEIGLHPENNVTRAFLTVAVDGKAPYTEIVELSESETYSILAEASSKPILTEVFDLGSLTQSARETSFLRFGLKEGSGGVESFSKLMTLSEFKAMAENNVTLEDGELSSALIPTANFPAGLRTLQVEMQSYSADDEDDFRAFPGELTGFGQDEGVSAQAADSNESERVQLESAAFDLLKLTDENGNIVDLDNSASNASKLRTFADGAVCNGMQWTRYLRSSEVTIIKKWPDESTDPGYQVPLWSNDNATGSWSYLGLATIPDIDSSRPYFTMCVGKKWQGYVNCDTPLATSRPQQMCVTTQDQNGNPLGSIRIRGKKGGNYASAYTRYYGDSIGKASIEIKDADITGWEYTYSAALTGWQKIDIDESTISQSSNPDCDYDLNITVHNPYTTVAHVKVYDINDTAKANPLDGKYVRLYNSEYGNYYNKGARTVNGEATFEIKPNVVYRATYESGEVDFEANGIVGPNETADTTREVYVDVQDVDVAPSVNVYAYKHYLSNESTEMNYYMSARDRNGDTLTLDGLYIDGTLLTKDTHYTVERSSIYDGYYYIRGVIKLNALPSSIDHQLAASDTAYKLSAKVSDANNQSSDEDNFTIRENQAPYVNSLYLKDENNRYYYPTSRSIPEGNFTLAVSAYDRERDSFDTFIKVDDGVEQNIVTLGSVSLTKGSHTITVIVRETSTSAQLETTRVYSDIYVGNHAPRIGNFYPNDTFVNSGESIRLTAYAYDDERSELNVTAVANGTEYPMTKVYGSRYQSSDITISAETTFSVTATDGEDVSSDKNTTVYVNSAPTFDDNQIALTDRVIFTGDTEQFNCSATDPEGTSVSYQWFIDGVAQSSYPSYYNQNFSYQFDDVGDFNVSCAAHDRDGASVSREGNASISVNQAPIFDTNLTDMTIFAGTTQTLRCRASDPENRGDVTYSWRVDGTLLNSETNESLTYLFSDLTTYSVSCTATDFDGKYSTTSATISVTSTPNQPPVFDNRYMTLSVDANTTTTGTIGFSDDGTATVSVDRTYPGFVLQSDGSYEYNSNAYAMLAKGETRDLIINVILTDNLGANPTDGAAELFITITGTYEASGTPADTNGTSAFTDGMSIYGFDVDYLSVSLERTELNSGTLEWSEYTFDMNTLTFIENKDDNSSNLVYVLNGAVWTAMSNLTYTLTNENRLLTLSNGTEAVLHVEDLNGTTHQFSEAYDGVTELPVADINVTFSSGAALYTLAVKEAQQYIVYYTPKLQEQNSTTYEWYETNTTFSSIPAYMQSVNGFEIGGFERDLTTEVSGQLYHSYSVIDKNGTTVTSLTEEQEGNIVSVDASTGWPFTQTVVGTWSVQALPNGELGVMVTSTGTDSTILVAVVNSTVMIGDYTPGSETFVTDKSLNFNEQAYIDIMNALKEAFKNPEYTALLNTISSIGITLYSIEDGNATQITFDANGTYYGTNSNGDWGDENNTYEVSATGITLRDTEFPSAFLAMTPIGVSADGKGIVLATLDNNGVTGTQVVYLTAADRDAAMGGTVTPITFDMQAYFYGKTLYTINNSGVIGSLASTTFETDYTFYGNDPDLWDDNETYELNSTHLTLHLSDGGGVVTFTHVASLPGGAESFQIAFSLTPEKNFVSIVYADEADRDTAAALLSSVTPYPIDLASLATGSKIAVNNNSDGSGFTWYYRVDSSSSITAEDVNQNTMWSSTYTNSTNVVIIAAPSGETNWNYLTLTFYTDEKGVNRVHGVYDGDPAVTGMIPFLEKPFTIISGV